MKKVRYNFLGSQNFILSGQIDLPESENPCAYALFAHCFTCTKNIKAVNNINKS